jgi:hypothetical protein
MRQLIKDEINLYIDESGRPHIGDPKYRFFLIAAVAMTKEQNTLANLLFSKWRNRFISDDHKYRAFHAVDFFEEYKNGYRRKNMVFTKSFSSAIDALIEIFKYIEIEAKCFYIDRQKLRTLMHIKAPPALLINEVDNRPHSYEYKKIQKEYRDHIKKQTTKEFEPQTLSLHAAFSYHAHLINKSHSKQGAINFESLSSQDSRLVEIFHKYNNPDYIEGKQITCINYHTKASLDSGIEIADLVSYVSFQSLRNKYHLKKELSDIPEDRIGYIIRLRKMMRDSLGIELVDVTEEYKKS